MNTYGRVEVQLRYCIGDAVHPRAALDIKEQRKISYPCSELNTNSLIIQPIT
jgi:hypothetical protein